MKSKIVIDLKNIIKTYELGGQKVHAVNNISLKVKKGEFIAIMGASGSGKSTTMNIIGMLDFPTSGDYLFNGVNVAKIDEDKQAEIRNKEIGFIFQSFNLIKRTSVYFNVERPMVFSKIKKSERKKRILDVLKVVGLADKVDNLSNQLSGGQIQRVAVARALVMQPSILLADEPTGNLDSKTAKEIMSFLVDLNKKGNTIILITHEQEIADYARRVVTLKDGAIISDTKRE